MRGKVRVERSVITCLEQFDFLNKVRGTDGIRHSVMSVLFFEE